MAVTKIWAIKDSLSRVVDYAANPEKTIYSDLQSVIHYAANGEKTVSGNEQACYVTGVNCNAETAFEEMYAVQERFNKISGNVAYHAYQSFKTGEVTPEQCHSIGVQLARDMWGTDYQVLVATHFNTGTYHNHFVINSVNMWTGKKFDCNKKAYYKFRDLSDKLCRDNELTVIENPSGKTPRSIHFAEKNNEPTKYNLMRQAIDEAICTCVKAGEFRKIMLMKGYIVDFNPYHKYATIRSVNDKKNTRLYRLGENYTPEAISERIQNKDIDERFVEHNIFFATYKPRYIKPKKCYFKGSIKQTKKVTGLKALYLYYCYLLGYLPKKKQHKPLSPEMREACRRLDRYSKEIDLICREKLDSLDDVNAFIISSKEQISLLESERRHIYNKLRRCDDPDTRAELFSKRDRYTSALTLLRKDVRTANNILTDNKEIKENIKAEKNIHHQQYLTKSQLRRRERQWER